MPSKPCVLPLRKRSFIIIVQRGHDQFLNILLVGWWWGKWECCQLKSWPLPTKGEWKTRRPNSEEIEMWLLFSARGEWNTVGSCLKNCDPHLWGPRGLYWRRQWHPTTVLLPGKPHGWRSLVGCSLRGCEELDTTEWLQFHFSLSCIGEGNGNPLQCSCLENPRDGRAWWAAVYGVAQSRTRLKRLSSSSSRGLYKARPCSQE